MRGLIKRRRGSLSPGSFRNSTSIKTGVTSSLNSLPRISLSRLNPGSISDFFNQPPKLLTSKEQIKIDVHIKSNWGDEKMITLSEIDFLDVRGHPIEVIKVIPQHLHDQSVNLAELTNHIIIKESIKDCWHHIWPYACRNLIFTFTLQTDDIPVSARIWNISTNPEMQTKDIEIRIGNVIMYEGTVPQNYGSVVYLKNSTPLSLLAQGNVSFLYPHHKSDHLRVTILQLVEDNNPYFSFSLELYDQNNKLINGEDISGITCINCHPVEAKERSILRGESEYDINTGRISDDPIKMTRTPTLLPQIIIDFSIPICIAYVKIFGKAMIAPGVYRIKLETNFDQSIISTTEKERIYLVDPAYVSGYSKNTLLDGKPEINDLFFKGMESFPKLIVKY